MTLEKQITAMRARIEEATARQKLSLNQGKFDRESFQLINDMQLKWIDKRMEVETHVAKMRKESQDIQRRQDIILFHRREINRLLGIRSALGRDVDILTRRVRRAERIFQGSSIKTKHRASCWIAFGQLTQLSQLRFRLGSSNKFYLWVGINKWESVKNFPTYPATITMHNLATYCQLNKLMLDPNDEQFGVIAEAFKEINDAATQKIADVYLQMEMTRQRLIETNESQRQGF